MPKLNNYSSAVSEQKSLPLFAGFAMENVKQLQYLTVNHKLFMGNWGMGWFMDKDIQLLGFDFGSAWF